MQALWSRIAQTGLGCHCPSCVSAGASGIARRTGNAAGRRPVRWALSSTFVYSGIFAAAATTDAGFKQKRREQWDRAIADIKHDLDQPALETPEVEHKPDQAKKEDEETVRWKPLFDELQQAILEGPQFGEGPVWPANTGAGLKRGCLPPTSIYAGTLSRRRARDSRWSTKKTRTSELAVDKLILRTLLHLESLGSRKHITNAVSDSCLGLFGASTSHLKALLLFTTEQHNEAYNFPDPNAHPDDLPRQHKYGVTYKQDEAGEFHGIAEELDSALAQLFKKTKSGQLSYHDLIAKIAYNLYISPVAPSLDCWNTLLCGFMDCEDAHMANLTIHAIRNANVRRNEITLKETLKYYIMVNSRPGFSKFVDRMRGLRGGLSLAKPGIWVTDLGRPRLMVDEVTKKVYQKPYPNPGVFEVLIQGVLHFVGFDAALRVCKDMGNNGWGLSTRGLTSLLDDRARNADYEAGCQIWDLIKSLQKESYMARQPEKLFAQTYSAMLRLCSACNQMTRFEEILREARAAKYAHQELLDLFRHETHAEPGIRQLARPQVSIQDLVYSVRQEDFQRIEEKEPVGKSKPEQVLELSSSLPDTLTTASLDQLADLSHAEEGRLALSQAAVDEKLDQHEDDWLEISLAAGVRG
ncbi:hypothetical protein E4T39_03942 [Aureobasidium subglaciale]|nr:hypothetical protein E4T39_03942 [Aureobasidium subglaciale]